MEADSDVNHHHENMYACFNHTHGLLLINKRHMLPALKWSLSAQRAPRSAARRNLDASSQSIMPGCMTECSGTGDFLTLPAGDLAGGVLAFISFCKRINFTISNESNNSAIHRAPARGQKRKFVSRSPLYQLPRSSTGACSVLEKPHEALRRDGRKQRGHGRPLERHRG